jgi:hypothetical protein
LNKPNIAFTANAKVPLEMFCIHSGYSFSLDETHLNFFPDQTNLLITANMRQAEYNRLDFGTALEFKPLIVMRRQGKKEKVITVTLSVNLFGSIQLNRFVFFLFL